MLLWNISRDYLRWSMVQNPTLPWYNTRGTRSTYNPVRFFFTNFQRQILPIVLDRAFSHTNACGPMTRQYKRRLWQKRIVFRPLNSTLKKKIYIYKRTVGQQTDPPLWSAHCKTIKHKRRTLQFAAVTIIIIIIPNNNNK